MVELATQSKLDFPALRDARYPVHRIAADLEPYLRAIVEHLHPEKIILFGSQAYGNPTEHSDVDLLIVRQTEKTMLESNLEIRRTFRNVEAPSVSFTLISLTPALLNEKLVKRAFLFTDIFEHGVELYAS